MTRAPTTGTSPHPLPDLSLLLTYEFPPMAGGTAEVMGELARWHPPDTLVVSTGGSGTGEEERLDAGLPSRVDRLPVPARRLRSLRGLLLWARAAARLARECDPRFTWCGTLRPAAYPAKWLRERTGVPYGVLVHGPDLLRLQHRIHQSRVSAGTVRSLIGSASVIVANSAWTRSLCARLLVEIGIEPSPTRLRVVPLGVDPDSFRPGIAADAVRERYSLAQGRWLLTVSPLAVHKGVDVTLRALARLATDFPDLRYAVVGAGGDQDTLSRLAGELGVADQVRFLTDVPAAHLPALYNVAELYLGVSRQAGLDADGFSLAVLEASATGIPVIGGKSGGVREAIREGETGLLVDSQDDAALAEAMRSVLGDPDRGRAMGTAGRKAVETYYNWSRVVGDLRAISAEFAVERSQALPR